MRFAIKILILLFASFKQATLACPESPVGLEAYGASDGASEAETSEMCLSWANTSIPSLSRSVSNA